MIKKSFKNKNTMPYRVLESQIASLKKLDHPNLAKLYTFIDDPASSFLYFICEYAPKGNLFDLINKNGPLSLIQIWKYTRQIIDALDYGYTVAGLIHRNITLANIMLDENDNIKICDFGHHFIFSEEDSKPAPLNSQYIAPELTNSNFRDSRTDLWSLGICIFYMITGNFPFKGADLADLYNEICTKKYF